MVCNQGDYVIYIRPTGEVLLCGSIPPIGNIGTGSIKNLGICRKLFCEENKFMNAERVVLM